MLSMFINNSYFCTFDLNFLYERTSALLDRILICLIRIINEKTSDGSANKKLLKTINKTSLIKIVDDKISEIRSMF